MILCVVPVPVILGREALLTLVNLLPSSRSLSPSLSPSSSPSSSSSSSSIFLTNFSLIASFKASTDFIDLIFTI
ncbi:hypothetical protein O181_050514 [Austropuccinia psidii MF-1]|uniref:Uncharacterized protein n=1 Tax=Austropuccinia psidii MF-1 TaxID=1389203 RepID=A0A9Q3DWW7_9BASI|nr:hypothetical protein [Austropuccinia psidii MF-1]